jgi:hypothetical protein
MAFVLISLYSVVILLATMTLIKMITSKTGLKWDPTTLADQLALFHGSNALGEFRALEQLHRERAFDLLAESSFSLGYWKSSKEGKTRTWYGIGKVMSATSKPLPHPSPLPELAALGQIIQKRTHIFFYIYFWSAELVLHHLLPARNKCVCTTTLTFSQRKMDTI